MNIPILETDRLILRKITIEDANDVFAWVGDPRVTKYMIYCTYDNVDQVKTWIKSLYKENSQNYEYLIVEKETGKTIGAVGISKNNAENAWSFGYNLRYDSWGKGFATEATKRLIKFAIEDLNVKDFESSHAVENKASGNVIRKCGLVFDHYATYSKQDGSSSFKSAVYYLHLK